MDIDVTIHGLADYRATITGLHVPAWLTRNLDLIDGYVDADGEDVQPYFAAFMIEKGYTRAQHIFERDGHGIEYQEWNRARWKEFKIPRGLSLETTSPQDHEDFAHWLNDRCIDHACRNYIERGAA